MLKSGRDCPDSLWLQDSSTYELNFTTFMKFWSHYSSCASSFIPFALSESHDRFAPGIISNSLWLLDNSAKKLQCALLLKFKPHYVQQISVADDLQLCASLLKLESHDHYPTSLRSWDNSPNSSNFTPFVLPTRFALGIIRPASFSTLCF